MKKFIFCILIILSSSVYGLSPILEAQQLNTDKAVALLDATGPAVTLIKNDFIYLQNSGVIPSEVELMVKEKSYLAAVVSKQIIIVNVKLSKYTRLERLFILTHEAGHIVHNDREDTNKLFNLYIPDNITKTEAYHRFNELKPQLCIVLHRHEYEADDYSVQSLLKLGYNKEEILVAAANVLDDNDSNLTHPASSDRIKRQKK